MYNFETHTHIVTLSVGMTSYNSLVLTSADLKNRVPLREKLMSRHELLFTDFVVSHRDDKRIATDRSPARPGPGGFPGSLV